MTRRGALAGALLALAGASLSWWFWRAPEAVPAQARWLSVAPGPLDRQLGLVGRIEAMRQVTLAAPFEGVVTALPVRDGERVRAGQALLVLDTAQLDIQLRQAEAERLKASAVLHELRGWATGPEVARARRARLAARHSAAVTEASLADTRRLFKRGIVARLEVEALEQQLRAQRQDLASAEDELRQTLARGQGEQVVIAEMEATNAQARHAALLALRARQVVLAPFAGLVLKPASQAQGRQQPVQVGEAVGQGMPLLELLDLGQLRVVAAVEQMDLAALREGMAVQVSGEGFAGQVLHGRVEALGLQAREAQGQGAWFDLLVALDTDPAPLGLGVRLGMSVQVTVSLEGDRQALVLPLEALRSDAQGGRYVVFRADGEQAARSVPVVVGQAVLQGVEVQGLEAGQVLLP
ncbi:HlyD family efflux transporter periplasmic adaptor subunit [Pseudomonas entomophila]|uniref:efflux RND transporter periplasmic adaptor subunit n=1 Tax=Pseudomonas entomophila TaxID=312306 RepID=UPI0023D7E89B|nr:HlyD family efflux transporter periplasmic adaptor subunit [Pseudomonas entomophila]MDF0730683.1 HlyD family efflux transporter periplasmic adaptor subunit [Pseudomonas entomophila]